MGVGDSAVVVSMLENHKQLLNHARSRDLQTMTAVKAYMRMLSHSKDKVLEVVAVDLLPRNRLSIITKPVHSRSQQVAEVLAAALLLYHKSLVTILVITDFSRTMRTQMDLSRIST